MIKITHKITVFALIAVICLVVQGCFGSTTATDIVNRLLTGQGGDTGGGWSPGGFGDKLVFCSDRTETFQVYIMNKDGSNQVQLTSEGWNRSPAFMPNGNIVFRSGRDGNSEIYVMSIDGSSQTRITHEVAFDGYPTSWPDGSKLLFQSDRDHGGTRNVFTMNWDETNIFDVTNSVTWSGLPSVNPSGSRIVYSLNGEDIYTINPDGSGNLMLANTGNNSAPYYSPDGTKICFSSDRDGNSEIYVMDADGSNQTRLTNDAGDDDYCRFLPDGTIGFSSDRTGSYQIYKINPDGTGLTQITTDNPENYLWN
ncbi:MAG: DUF5050 domain-containing protein [Chloroflexi bacterium]|nr:DUF5050 domain-containing protein [Chloroflexota bacterium]